ncbi:ABC transporter ATP-binding protein [Propionicimonas sp.]|uniref:ABC transporter ATP-binding protein n=1 Tax=Propionicimonas sp. TaxID=1955623 RepID=UPI001830B102|nr:ABC transporter ATP-binding protein [Propionicimonas sp.]MBU3977846.1 ABC transporter ATP-binding protein [Actinomycetota bacterium]MBA3021930.1 ABC transporter ATP-binding protein [Propionicimonas sp.]MBU3987623.1 ABC transporter ATP-binding protein [Actinomycetota bacterium]MBU4007345.1 ABC transporter ATP-binding protein [Actinomycetota bacterium]MBU4065709.1 ABC transporter ATP-binding protein [Actinomycetota bacterium]
MQSTSPGTSAISARGLHKSFGTTEAVIDLDLDVATGAVYGLLGPDGAGKSTLIRMIATVLTPDAGAAEVFGHSVTDQRGKVTPRIGYMSQRFSMYPDLSVAENLEFFATVRGVSRADRNSRAKSLLESMGLAEFANRQAQHLSGGMKQKLMLASTLMHSPDLLLLDEPTTGVDPVSRREFWRILAGLHREGRTVLVATPYMDEAERCTHIAFLDRGRIRQSGTPEQIKAQVPGRLLEVASAEPRRTLAAVVALPGVDSAHLFGDLVRVLWTGAADPIEALTAGLGGTDASLTVRTANIDMETVFAYLAENAPADAAAVSS